MIVLKILAAPVMVALSLLAAMVTFLFCVASAVCELGCIVLTLLSLILFIGGQTVGGIVFLVLAFLVSPFGVPAIAEWLVDKLHSAKFALRDFITGSYFGTKCPEVVKAGERRKAAPRQVIGSPQPTAFSAVRTVAPKGWHSPFGAP